MRTGHLITLTLVVALVASSLRVALTAPIASGAHLIGAPLLLLAAGAIATRYCYIAERTNRS